MHPWKVLAADQSRFQSQSVHLHAIYNDCVLSYWPDKLCDHTIMENIEKLTWAYELCVSRRRAAMSCDISLRNFWTTVS